MKKVILAIAVVSCIGILVGGSIYWNNKIEQTTAQAYEQLGIEREHYQKDNRVDQNVTTSSTKAENGETDNQRPANIEGNASSSNNNQTNAVNGEPNGQVSSNSSNPITNEDEKKSLVEIKRSYYSTFEELQVIQEGNANTVIQEAKKDIQKVSSGEMNRNDFLVKFQDKVVQLESKTDALFNERFRSLQQELTANGYSQNEAQEFRIAYEKRKDEFQNRVMRELNNLD